MTRHPRPLLAFFGQPSLQFRSVDFHLRFAQRQFIDGDAVLFAQSLSILIASLGIGQRCSRLFGFGL